MGFLLKFLTASRLGVGSWFLRHSCPAHMVGAAGAEKHEYCALLYQLSSAHEGTHSGRQLGPSAR